MLKRMTKIFFAVWVLAFVLNLVLWTCGYAQEAASVEPGAPWWKPILNMFFVSVVPALWTTIGPIVVAWVTSMVNEYKTYVPRSVQVALSAIITGGLAALTGDPSGVVQAAAEGAQGQLLAATPPALLLTEAPK